MATSRQIVVDPFCDRAFNDPTYSGYLNTDKEAFENQLNECESCCCFLLSLVTFL